MKSTMTENGIPVGGQGEEITDAQWAARCEQWTLEVRQIKVSRNHLELNRWTVFSVEQSMNRVERIPGCPTFRERIDAEQTKVDLLKK